MIRFFFGWIQIFSRFLSSPVGLFLFPVSIAVSTCPFRLIVGAFFMIDGGRSISYTSVYVAHVNVASEIVLLVSGSRNVRKKCGCVFFRRYDIKQWCLSSGGFITVGTHLMNLERILFAILIEFQYHVDSKYEINHLPEITRHNIMIVNESSPIQKLNNLLTSVFTEFAHICSSRPSEHTPV